MCHTALCWCVITALCHCVILLCVDVSYCIVLLQRVRARCLSSWPQWKTVQQSTCGSVLLPSSPGCHTGHWVLWTSSQMSVLFWLRLSWMSSQTSLLFWHWLSWMSSQISMLFWHWLSWMSSQIPFLLTLDTGCNGCQSEISLFFLHRTLIIMDVTHKYLVILTLDSIIDVSHNSDYHGCRSQIFLLYWQ